MHPTLFKRLRLAAALLMLGIGGAAHSAILFTATEVGSDVVITGSGSFDLTGMTLTTTGSAFSGFLNPSSGVVRGGSGGLDVYSGLSGPATFGAGGPALSSSATGDVMAVQFGTSLVLPTGYASGNPLSATATWSGQSFASLGMTVGSYAWTSTNDSVTFNIVPTASVPEVGAALPINLALMAIGAIAVRRRARR